METLMGPTDAVVTQPLTSLATVMGVIPSGLDVLRDVSYMEIKQRLEPFEIICGIETKNKYDVFAQGRQLFHVAETTNCCSVVCCGPARGFSLEILGTSNEPILYLERPCGTLLCCTAGSKLFCCLGQLGGTLSVRLQDQSLCGKLVHKFSCYNPKYKVYDENGNHVLTIEGPCCGECCLCNCKYCICRPSAKYPIINAVTGEKIGMIRKKFNGCCQEAFTDADTFGLQIPQNMNIKWKGLLLSAIFLIDFMYYESKPDKRGRAAVAPIVTQAL